MFAVNSYRIVEELDVGCEKKKKKKSSDDSNSWPKQ